MLLWRYTTRTVLIVPHLFLSQVLFLVMLRSLKQYVEDILIFRGSLRDPPGSPWKARVLCNYAGVNRPDPPPLISNTGFIAIWENVPWCPPLGEIFGLSWCLSNLKLGANTMPGAPFFSFSVVVCASFLCCVVSLVVLSSSFSSSFFCFLAVWSWSKVYLQLSQLLVSFVCLVGLPVASCLKFPASFLVVSLTGLVLVGVESWGWCLGWFGWCFCWMLGRLELVGCLLGWRVLR